MSRRIELTRGQFAVVDDEDYEMLSEYSWQARFCKCVGSYYAQRKALKEEPFSSEQMSRRVMGLRHGDPREVDHANHDTLDNRKKNLRIVSKRENHRNRLNQSKLGIGVYRRSDRSRRKPYRAQVSIDGRTRCIGDFETAEEALRAREEFVRKEKL